MCNFPRLVNIDPAFEEPKANARGTQKSGRMPRTGVQGRIPGSVFCSLAHSVGLKESTLVVSFG